MQDSDIAGAFQIVGFSFSGAASNQGLMFVSTKPANERKAKGHTATDIVARLSPRLQMLAMAPNGGMVFLLQPPAVSGVGAYGGFQFVLEDSGKNTLTDLDRVAHQIMGASRAAQGYNQPDHHLLGQRPPGAGHYRSREGQSDEHPALADHHHA